MNNDALKDAVIEAARHLVHKHTRSEIQVIKASGDASLRIEISPTKGQGFVRYFNEHEPIVDDFMSALADLVGAVDAYEEWAAEMEGMSDE